MKKTLIVGLLCTLSLAVLLILFVVLNDFRLVLRTQSEDVQILEYGHPFQHEPITVSLEGAGIIPVNIPLPECRTVVTGDLREDVLGIYTLTFEAEYLFWKGSTEKTIHVVDTQCPVITLVSGGEDIFSEDRKYQEPGYTAIDNLDGDISERVVRIETPGLITYAVVDSSGNPAYAEREITYYDTVPPVIELTGGEEYTITVGTVFSDPGYNATDDTDGDLTEAVIVQGMVDWLTPGAYPVEYQVTDTCGNVSCAVRNVTVEAAPWPDTQWPERKTIYLTFDDGPGPYTKALLDVLDQYGVKATFFVVDSGYDALMGEIVRRGHSIGIHSVTHNYEQIYSSPEAYFEDLYRMQDVIYENTGVKTTLLRFPGGGSNLVSKNTSKGIMSILTQAVRNAGFQYFDWNVDSDDAGKAKKAEQVRENVITGIRQTGTCIVLQHDTNPYSVEAVEEIILWGQQHGYQFASITESSPGFHHDVLN